METPLHTHVACPLNPYGVLQIILHRKNAKVPCFMVKLPYELHILQISCTVKITHAIRVLGAILHQIHFAKDWIGTSISYNQLLVLRRTKPYASTKPNLFKYLNNLLVIRMTLVPWKPSESLSSEVCNKKPVTVLIWRTIGLFVLCNYQFAHWTVTP